MIVYIEKARLDRGQFGGIYMIYMVFYPGMRNIHRMDAAETLTRTALFRDLSEESIARIAGKARRLEIARGEHLFLEGDEGDDLFVLSEGGVRLYKLAADGQETTVKLVGPLEAFAEIAFFDRGRYPVSAVATKYSVAWSVSGSTFEALLEDPAFRREFIATIIGRLRYLSQRIQYLTAYDVEERFFRFLHEQCGPAETCTVRIPKKEIAAAIGTVPETLSRMILRLRERGVIEWKGSTIKLPEGFWDEQEID
jgi:CRP/FNR family transcriptional regulator